MNAPGSGAEQIELARWQGGIDQRIDEGDRRFDRLEAKVDSIDTKVDRANEEIATLKVKVAFYGAIGGAVGSGIVALIVAFGTKAIGG